MKIVRYNETMVRIYRVYPFLKPDDELSTNLPQYISVICEYGNVTITTNFQYRNGTTWGAMQMGNAWQMVYKIAIELETNYDAEIAVDEVVEREVQS